MSEILRLLRIFADLRQMELVVGSDGSETILERLRELLAQFLDTSWRPAKRDDAIELLLLMRSALAGVQGVEITNLTDDDIDDTDLDDADGATNAILAGRLPFAEAVAAIETCAGFIQEQRFADGFVTVDSVVTEHISAWHSEQNVAKSPVRSASETAQTLKMAGEFVVRSTKTHVGVDTASLRGLLLKGAEVFARREALAEMRTPASAVGILCALRATLAAGQDFAAEEFDDLQFKKVTKAVAPRTARTVLNRARMHMAGHRWYCAYVAIDEYLQKVLAKAK
ncbi:MAG TPA: hypothetical protein VGZ02_10545 [Candidatus Baltobacteraceae bacterium]|jgi:hypothetical protein|nr:hypothetical protein [Candidatus Baltobacteraceae bacterium]